jgi:hypothetical protein
VPLASDTFGDPSRFRDAAPGPFFKGSVCFGRPDGVTFPLVEGAESFLFLSSSAFRSSSRNRSASLSSEL